MINTTESLRLLDGIPALFSELIQQASMVRSSVLVRACGPQSLGVGAYGCLTLGIQAQTFKMCEGCDCTAAGMPLSQAAHFWA
eukprot:4820677-Amphidinium_carterae.1